MSGLHLAGTTLLSPRWVFDSNRWQTGTRQVLMPRLAHVAPPMIVKIPETNWARSPSRADEAPQCHITRPDPILPSHFDRRAGMIGRRNYVRWPVSANMPSNGYFPAMAAASIATHPNFAMRSRASWPKSPKTPHLFNRRSIYDRSTRNFPE